MHWAARAVVVTAIVALPTMGGCRDRLSEEACQGLRSQAFDIINGVHPCAEDTDCVPSDWPGCAKPLNTDDHRRIGQLKAKFDQGQCQEPEARCGELVEMHCDRNFCVARPPAGAGPKGNAR